MCLAMALAEARMTVKESESPVTSQSHDANVAGATPRERRGKSMSRRRGQLGHEEKSGNWYVVRFWMDVPGREQRELKRERICPVTGPGSLTPSERLRRRREIIGASGADSVEHFERVQAINYGMTFRKQAEQWLSQMKNRKREPLAASTYKTWRSCVEDDYDRMREDVEFRKQVVESVGLGFEIPASTPSIVPNVPKLAVEGVEEVAVSC
jgi:hypothetical protein